MVTVWKIAPGEGAWVWDDCIKRGCISVNWLNHTDYSQFPGKAEIKRALIKAKEGKGGGGAHSIWQFTNEVGQDHVVLANDGLSRVVGVGVMTSGYLWPDHPRNPNSSQDYHRHVRLVRWVVAKPVDLKTKLFVQHTVQRLAPQQWRVVVRAYKKRYPELQGLLDELFTQEAGDDLLGPAADESDAKDDDDYHAPEEDLREQAWQQIKKRRGQPRFRNALIRRYGKQCLVTGCKVVAALEAAHIDPYRGEGNNHPGNGLLLRADIHTLFDLNLVGIDPLDLRIKLHPDISEQYGNIVRKRLLCATNQRPLQEALKRRYKLFMKRTNFPS